MKWWFAFFVFLFLLPSSDAQPIDLDSLPQLLPSYIEDFTDYSTNPSICIDDIFLDKKKRVWLKNCGIEANMNIHIMQFDGYGFRVLKDELKQLKSSSELIALQDSVRLVGFDKTKARNQIFYFHLETGSLEFVDIGEYGQLLKVEYDKEQVLVLTEKEGQLCIYLLKEKEFTLVYQISLSDFPHLKGLEYWNYKLKNNKLFIIGDINEGAFCTVVDLLKKESFVIYSSAFNTPKHIFKPHSNSFLHIENIFTYKDDIYYYYFSEETSSGFIYKYVNDTFVLSYDIPLLKTPVSDLEVFKDDVGQYLFVYYTKENGLKVILEDRGGIYWDYSEMLSRFKNKHLKKLWSNNFVNEVFVLNTSGLLLQKIRKQEGVKGVIKKGAFRSLIELDDERILAKIQGPKKPVIIDLENETIIKVPVREETFKTQVLKKDPQGKIWTIDRTAISRFDPVTNEFDSYKTGKNGFRGYLEYMNEDSLVIIRGMNKQLSIYDLNTQTIHPILIDGKPFYFNVYINQILLASNNILWVATNAGLFKFDLDKGSYKVIGNSDAFKDNRILCISEMSNGDIWLGTVLGGVHILDAETEKVRVVNHENGLSSNTVVSITEDDEGDKWVGTYNGVSLISKEGNLITNLKESDGLVHRECNKYSNLKMSDGKIIIGTISGLNYLDPSVIKESLAKINKPSIYLTEVAYFNKKEGKLVKSQYDLGADKTIVLYASHKSVSLKFALSSYLKSEENIYAYRLLGKDDKWKDIGNKNTLDLDLTAGAYTLQIKGADAKGTWVETPASLKIVANEFFYKKPWFYTLLAMGVLLSGIFWIIRLRIEVRAATKEIYKDKKIIERQAEELKELDKAKSRFFTSITHEFRTPLTIINGMVDQMREYPEQWLDKGSEMVKENTSNLLDLINQILDLRNLELGEVQPNYIHGDIISYLFQIHEPFKSLAENQNVDLVWDSAISALEMDFDKEKTLRVFSNLLSNAIKFTGESERAGKTIQIFLQEKNIGNQEAYLSLEVKDNGIGIEKQDIPHIFNQFYQAEGEQKNKGYGIGLSLTKEIVELLGGEIRVESVSGEGSIFEILLPIRDHYKYRLEKSNEINSMEEEVETVPNPTCIDPNLNPVSEEGQVEKLNLLIVEDNKDIQAYLIAILESTYNLIVAKNGKQGIELAQTHIPDLIISDIMMPEKDGYEVCNVLKNDERTSHIPIILLTSKADFDSKISGLKKGADAYLTKPFEKEELLIRLEKLSELREKLQHFYSKFPLGELPKYTKKDKDKNDKERIFLSKVMDIIQENMNEEEFGTRALAHYLKLSRTQVHNKIKALTGKSTSILIRSVRLRKAAELLSSTDMNISEIAYEVGFKNHAYFSRIFNEEFQISPTDYREKHK